MVKDLQVPYLGMAHAAEYLNAWLDGTLVEAPLLEVPCLTGTSERCPDPLVPLVEPAYSVDLEPVVKKIVIGRESKKKNDGGKTGSACVEALASDWAKFVCPGSSMKNHSLRDDVSNVEVIA